MEGKNVNDQKGNDLLVQAVDRALTLLKLVSESNESIQINELVLKTQLNRTTVWRLLYTLEYHGFVERDPHTKGYRLGYSAAKMTQGTSRIDWLVRQARPSMEQLSDESQETVMLSIPRNIGVVAIDQINPPHHVRLVDYVNMVMPLHCTSNGKLVLASFSERELENFLKGPLEKLTSLTINDPDLLLKEIEEIRKSGFATNFGELDESENGISAPIFDLEGELVACLSLSGPSFRFTREILFKMMPRVVFFAKEIQNKLSL